MTALRKSTIGEYLAKLVTQYEELEAEKIYLLTQANTRIQTINSERQELIAEAQEALDRLNTLRIGDGEQAITLQDVRRIFGGPQRPK